MRHRPFISGEKILGNHRNVLGGIIVRFTGKALVLAFFFGLQCLPTDSFSAEKSLVEKGSGGNSTASSLAFQGKKESDAGLRLGELIESCWSQADLKGSVQEKQVTLSAGHQPRPLPMRIVPNADLPPLPQAWRNSIRRVQIPDGRKVMALTFDLCERKNEIAGYDAAIINSLRENKVKATFFAGGKWMQSHPERAMQLMADPLFEVGAHGWEHENFRLLSRNEAEEKFLLTQAQYELLREQLQKRCCSGDACKGMENIPILPRVFRFPFGTCNAATLDLLAANGVAAIQWDVVSGDPVKGQTARGITEIVLRQAKPGSIAIFHANGRGHGTSRALPGLIATLKSQGFEFLTVSELLRAGTPVASPYCYELKPGDNLRYDKFK